MNNNRQQFEEAEEGEYDREAKPDAGTLALLARAEVDGQIATARAFPRSVAAFAREVRELVTMDEASAASCIFSLPRGKERGPDGRMVPKFITGPSARFAEVLQYSFGNNRGGGRVVDVSGNFVIAQGVFHDLEKNVMVTMEVRRRITDSYGKRYNDDMITVTGNAAASIAHRNAVLKGVPRALWLPMYEAARLAAVGDLGTLQQRRDKMVAWFAHKGVTVEQVLAKLGKEGIEDIGLDEMEVLVGISTGLRDGSLSVEGVFGPEPTTHAAATGAAAAAGVAAEIAARGAAKDKPKDPTPDPAKASEPPKAESKPEPEPLELTGEISEQQRLILAMREATNRDKLDELADLVRELPRDQRAEAMAAYNENLTRLESEFGKV